MKMFLLFIVLVILFYWLRPFTWPAPEGFYAPKIHIDEEYFSISIPVEIADENGKQAFVKLFNKYGFSGNGPSIEQVIKINTNFKNVDFSSEGDFFVMYAQNAVNQASIVKELRCIEDIRCLNSWLNKARVVFPKE